MKAKALALVAFVLAGFAGTFSSPAIAAQGDETQNGVTCTPYTSPSKTYPADWDPVADPNAVKAHYWVCKKASGTIDTNAATQLYMFAQSWPTNLRDWYKARDYAIYYFYDRDDSNSFFSGKYNPILGGPSPGALISSTARCGNSGKPLGTTGRLTTMVWEKCKYPDNSISDNPNSRKVLAHEAGHIFDFGYARLNGGALPSASKAFKGLAAGSTSSTPPYAGDITYVKPANWSSMTQAQRVTYICNMYGVMVRPSVLEKGLAVTDEFVCLNSSEVSDNTSTGGHNFKTMDPAQIGALRIPYFNLTGSVSGASPAYEDLFAELFSKNFTSISGTNPLTMTDMALRDPGGLPCKTIGGVYTCNPAASTSIGSNAPPGSAYHCTTWALHEFFRTLNPPVANTGTATSPTQYSLKWQGCPDIPPADFSAN